MPEFDSFGPDGSQSSFFAAPAPQPLPPIGGQGGPSVQTAGSTYPEIPGAMPAPNQGPSGYYPDEPSKARGMVPFPQDADKLHEFGGMTRGIDRPPIAGDPGYDVASDPQIPPAARAAPEMHGAVSMNEQGRPVYDPGGQAPDPKIVGLTQQAPLGKGPGINLGRPQQHPPSIRYGHEAGGFQKQKEAELGPLRRDYEHSLDQRPPPPPAPPRLPDYEEWKQQHNHSVLQGSGPIFVAAAGAIMLMAGAFGGRGRAASIPALQGLAGFTQGLGNGNRSQAMKGLDDFKTGISELETTYHNSRQEYEDILRNQDIDIARKREKLMAAASKWTDIQTYNAAQQSAWARIDKQNEQREKGIRDAKKAADDAERKAREFEFKREDEDRKERDQQAREHRDAQREWSDANREYGKARESVRKAEAQTPPVQAAIDDAREFLAVTEERRRASKQALDAITARMSKGGSAVQGGSPQSSKQAIIDEARKAIANHAPPDAVRKRLQENGIDPSELDQPGGEAAPSADQSFGAPTPEIPTIGPATTGGGF